MPPVRPGDLQYTIYGAGGAEAIDIAIKTARNAMQKRKIVSIVKAYHGHTGLAVKTGAERFSKIFLSEDRQGEFIQVPVQRSRRHGGRAQEARRRRRHHGDDPGDLRLPDAE